MLVSVILTHIKTYFHSSHKLKDTWQACLEMISNRFALKIPAVAEILKKNLGVISTEKVDFQQQANSFLRKLLTNRHSASASSHFNVQTPKKQ